MLLVNLFPPFARACGSVPVLRELAQAVDREVVRQTGYLERSEIMEESLRDFGCAIVCDSLERCVELANEIAPEHLEIMTEEPRALLPLVKNAGAVFLGAYTPEPLGDYLAGPDHVLCLCNHMGKVDNFRFYRHGIHVRQIAVRSQHMRNGLLHRRVGNKKVNTIHGEHLLPCYILCKV